MDQENDFCFILTNFGGHVARDKLWEVFGAFGTIKQIEINTELWVAAVIYAFKPLDQIHTQLIYINDRLIQVKKIPLNDYLSVESCPVSASKLSFGGLKTHQVFIEEWSTQEYVTFDINLNENYLEVFFAHVDSYYRFRIDYNEKDFKNSILLQRQGNISSVIISGKYPAHFWRSKKPMQTIDNTYHLTDWERIVEIPLDEFSRDIMRQKSNSSNKPIKPGGQYPNHTIKLNSWTVYKIDFDILLKSSKKVNNMALCPENLTHEALETKIKQATNNPNIVAPEIITCIPTRKIEIEKLTSAMSFEVRYMIEHAFNLKILRDYNVEPDFFEKMQQLPPQVACSFLTLLSAPQQRVYNPNTVISHIYLLSKDHIGYQQYVPDDHILLRKVLITPTSMYPLQPTVEPMNHIQYHFKEHADRFLLVQFTDEDLAPVESTLPPDDNESSMSRNGKVYDRIYDVLRKGISIAGRVYDFLGTSIDDMRDHQCWFFAPTEDLNRADILNWMGDFREIKKVATFVNCTGRGLLPRLTELELKANEIEEIDDEEKNCYEFTNDCGKMSPQIAREIARLLSLDYTPCAVRFNLAGASGMLMLSNHLMKRKVQLHSSQIKFDSTRLTLEVIKIAQLNKVILDRKTISLLSSLGVKDYVFQDLLSEPLNQYKKYMLPKDEFSYDSMVEYYSNGTMNDFQSIIDSGFLDTTDPFINNLASAYQNNQLKAIQEDCKLHVRDGAKLFAVMDETRTLGMNEVFVQITDASGLASNRRVILGPCLVYRDNSCFPGDARVVDAVDVPQLRHFTNVLVYSSYDARDLPSCCSHDDTDKDDFNIVWDTRLLPPRANLSPRNYTPAMTPSNLNKIAFKEIAKFFTTYISKDRFDFLKKAYVAISDRHREGILHGDCIYLSQQLSRALDFAKTGVFATIYSEFHHYPFPDYMEENKLRTYSSKKPSGQIYHVSTQLTPKQYITNHCVYDPRLYIDGMYEYIAEARKSKSRYDHSLRILMGQYSVQTEIEFISGHIINWPKYLSKKDKPKFLDRLRAAYIRFRDEWRQHFELEFVVYDGDDVQEKIQAKVAAWYYVTYHRSEYKSDVTYNSTMARYMSFPWILDDYIAFIASENNDRPLKDYYLEAVPAEKINNAVKKDTLLLVSDDEDESEEDDDDSIDDSEEEEHIVIEQVPVQIENVNDSLVEERNSVNRVQAEEVIHFQTYQPPPEVEESDDVPVLSIKLSELMK